MSWFTPKNNFDKIFEGGLILKGISGLSEFLAGAMLFVVSPDQIKTLLSVLTQKEFLEDPNDLFASTLMTITSNISSGSNTFLIIYLWTHSLIKIIAVLGILRNKYWAYPFSILTLSLLTGYQIYSMVFIKFSLGLFSLTLFDFLIIWMIWREKSHIDSQKFITQT